MIMAIELWCVGAEATSILGDNLASLQEALTMKGKGLHERPAQVLAVLRCSRNLWLEVGHLPPEASWMADALSRQAGPTPERKPWPFQSSMRVGTDRPLRPLELWKLLV